MRDNSGISHSDRFQQLSAKRQQRPETPALISRIHTSSSHHTPHQSSDSAEEWIRPGSDLPTPAQDIPVDVAAGMAQVAEVIDRDAAAIDRGLARFQGLERFGEAGEAVGEAQGHS